MTHNGQIDCIHSPFSQISHSMHGMRINEAILVKQVCGSKVCGCGVTGAEST